MAGRLKVFLWTAGATIVSALLAGLVAVALQRGFGASDLSALAFWSAPLALVTASIAAIIGTAIARWSLALKYLIGLALGSVSGFLWTMVVATLLGPWFGAFSLPVLACWVVGGVCGMAAGLTAVSIGSLRFKLVEWLVLCAVAATGVVAYGPFVTWLQHDQTLTVIFLKWSPSGEPLAINSSSRIGISDEAMAVIRAAGVTGRVELVSSSVHGRGRPAAALVLMQAPLEKVVTVLQPDGGTALYVQSRDTFRVWPEAVTTIDREIEMFPDEQNHGAVRYMVRLAGGARQGGTAMQW